MKELIKSIEPLVQEELNRANAKFPQFASPHEGWAVIKEEVEEAENELENVKWELEDAWKRIKDELEPIRRIKLVREFAICLAAEAIQVAAMAQKFVNMHESKCGIKGILEDCETCTFCTEGKEKENE